MKFVIDYDMLKMIEESKNGRSFKHYFKRDMLGVLFGTGLVFFTHLEDKTIELISRLAFSLTVSSAIALPMSINQSKRSRKEVIDSANFKLKLLLSDLRSLEINTSLENLKDASINDISYKVVFEDDSYIPRLKQFKYIDIPLNNGYTETILQEHIYGDNDYEVSVGAPTKKKDYKLLNAYA